MILTKEKISSVNTNTLINEKLISSKLEELLIIVPTNRKLRSLKNDFILNSPNNTTGKINIETLVTLSSKLILGENYRNQLPSEAVVSVLLSQSFNSVELKYFNNYSNEIPSGTIDKIFNVISEYKKNGLTPSALKKSINNITDETEKRKGNDIVNIYEVYQKLLNELNLFETGDIYQAAASLKKNEFENKFRDIFPLVDTIIINGFDEFYNPEIIIIDNLSSITKSKLFLSFDYGNNEFLFNHLKKCFGEITNKGFNVIEDKSDNKDSDFINELKENLFKSELNKTDKYKSRIKLVKSPNRRSEIKFIAKEIKKLITTKNIKPNSISVVFNLIDNYSHIVKDIFTGYGIPVNITDRTPLSNSTPVIAIINFLEIIENNFYYKSLFRALSGSYHSNFNINLSNLYKVGVELNIISGYNKWIAQLDATIKSNEFEGKVNHNVKYSKAKADLQKLYLILKRFDDLLTPAEFNFQLNKFINELDIPIQLINKEGIMVEENVKAVTDFIELSNELTELYIDEYGNDNKFNLEFYLSNLRTAVNAARFNIKERQGYGVLVTTLNEVRGLKFDYVFIAGLNDGDFPTRYSPEIFFSPEYLERNLLKHRYGERFLFYQTLSSFNKELFLSVPLADEKKELMISNFINDFQQQFSVEEIDSGVNDEYIYSLDELLTEFKTIQEKNLINAFLSEKLIDFINKVITVEEKRYINNQDYDNYNGILSQDLLNNNEELSNLTNNTFSITQLELYAACPYKYFIERILKIEPLEEPDEDIESREVGQLLHNILFEFYIKIKEQNIILAGCDEIVFSKAYQTIFKIANEEIEKLNFDKEVNFFEYEKIIGINGNRENSILYQFLKSEQSLNPDFIPSLFEFSFGNLNPLMIEQFKLRGKIDRVDIDEKNKFFKVYDYKLGGNKPTEDELYKGLKLQLPLYLFAIIKEKGENYKPAEASIYSLKFKEGEISPLLLKPSRSKKTFETAQNEFIEFNNNLIENTKSKIINFIEGIIKGDFKLSPHEKREEIVCKYCEFKSVCRVSNLES